MIIRCPHCKKETELEHVERGRHVECSCRSKFTLDDATVVADYSKIDAAPPERIGPYRIERYIGRGGMGRVYKGMHPTLGIPVAVKIMLPEYTENAAFRERFIHSAKICAKLDHPNVVRVYDFGTEENGALYLVMEYIAGGTLEDLLMRSGPVTPHKAAEIAVAVCNALSVAQKNGIVHRDIKPDNIMLTSDGGCKLSDLGLAKYEPQQDEPKVHRSILPILSKKEETLEMTTLGTPEYMAPEQSLDAKNCDIRADIYSLGITLYQLLSGRLPFESSNRAELRRMHLEEEPKVPGVYRRDLPIDLEYIVMRCIQKRKADRYQTPEEILEDLHAFLAGGILPSTNNDALAVRQKSDIVPFENYIFKYIDSKEITKHLVRILTLLFTVLAVGLLIRKSLFPEHNSEESAVTPSAKPFTEIQYDRNKVWSDMKAKAEAALAANMNFSGAILNLKSFENDDVESIRKEARELLHKLTTASDAAVRKLMNELDAKSAEYERCGDYETAIHLYETANRLVPESHSARIARIAELEKKRSASETKKRLAREYIEREVVPSLLARNYKVAEKSYSDAKNPDRDSAISAILAECVRIPALFAETQRANINQHCEFAFRTEPFLLYRSRGETLRIQKVIPPKVFLHDHGEVSFTIQDLTVEEQSKCLAGIRNLTAEARALWCVGETLAMDPREALPFAEGLPASLREVYYQYIGLRIAENRRNEFYKDLRRFLEEIGYKSADIPMPEDLPQLEIFSVQAPEGLLIRLNALIERYGDLPTASQYIESFRILYKNLEKRIPPFNFTSEKTMTPEMEPSAL